MIRLRARHSHLFPGARGDVVGEGFGSVEVEFSDGMVARGTFEGERLSLGRHRTRAGADVPARDWRVEIDGETFRIVAPLF